MVCDPPRARGNVIVSRLYRRIVYIIGLCVVGLIMLASVALAYLFRGSEQTYLFGPFLGVLAMVAFAPIWAIAWIAAYSADKAAGTPVVEDADALKATFD